MSRRPVDTCVLTWIHPRDRTRKHRSTVSYFLQRGFTPFTAAIHAFTPELCPLLIHAAAHRCYLYSSLSSQSDVGGERSRRRLVEIYRKSSRKKLASSSLKSDAAYRAINRIWLFVGLIPKTGSNKKPRRCDAIWEVCLENGRYKVTLRSALEVVNKCGAWLEVRCSTDTFAAGRGGGGGTSKEEVVGTASTCVEHST